MSKAGHSSDGDFNPDWLLIDYLEEFPIYAQNPVVLPPLTRRLLPGEDPILARFRLQ